MSGPIMETVEMAQNERGINKSRTVHTMGWPSRPAQRALSGTNQSSREAQHKHDEIYRYLAHRVQGNSVERGPREREVSV